MIAVPEPTGLKPGECSSCMPAPDNSTRWERYVRGEPEDHVPMTADELAELDEHLDRASGW